MEKIKKSMRREDGFTLVELLAVIVILGIILAIAIPAIGGVIGRARSQASEQEINLVIDAARLYITAEPDSVVGWSSNVATIAVSALYEKGYLEDSGDGVPESGNKLSGTVTVTRTPITGSTGFTYEYAYPTT